MKIVILCHNLHVAGGRNVGLNFVRHLKDCPANHKYLVVSPPNSGYEDIVLPDDSKIYIYKGGRNLFNRLRFDCFQLPEIVKEFDADVLLGLGNLGVTKRICRQAILFADSHLIYPLKHYAKENYKSRLSKWLMKRRMMQCLKYTDLIFCQTPVTKKRFSKVYNFPLDKIKILSKAVSEFSKISKYQADVPQVLNNGNYYNLFYLAKFYAHKNFEILIDLFRKYGKNELKDVRCIITITAQQHKNAPKFLQDIKKYNLQEHIVNVGPLDEQQLAGYFYNCNALFFPSLLESFSSTHLEAMYFELPILTSELDFGRFACDNAAIYFDPWSDEDAKDKILMLKNNHELKEQLIENGKNRVSSFFKGWSEIVNEALEDLQKLLNRN